VKLAELFYSIQGEGKLMGVPSVFVRASGCNLRCVWCDTPYASWNPEGEYVPVEEIVRRVRQHSVRHVVLTGGEPTIMPDFAALCAALKENDFHVTVETAATYFVEAPMNLASLSPKLANSTPTQRDHGRYAANHERQRINPGVIQQWIDSADDFQLKFVVSSPTDMAEIGAVLDSIKRWSPADVLLMPEGTDAAVLDSRGPWIADICKDRGFRFCPRLHIALYGNRRGT
jgi:7-carboxy-7-deazaguanine synthase